MTGSNPKHQIPEQQSSDKLEVILFGSGYGESILVHCGVEGWIIIDSCLTRDSVLPAPLYYLESIGVDASTDVIAVVATHWHDDHIKGMSQIAKKCSAATFYISAALMTSKDSKKFRTLVLDSSISRLANLNADSASGVKEFREVLETLHARGDKSKLIFALEDKLLLERKGLSLWSLSPHSSIFHKALDAIIAQIPDAKGCIKRIKAPLPNFTSIVLWLKHENTRVLFGADIEEANEHKGWSLIIDGKKPSIIDIRGSLYKVAHHGSDTGHHDMIYESLLEKNPLCLIAPFNRNPKLPKQEDLQRILKFTNAAYISTSSQLSKPKKALDRIIKSKLSEHNASLLYPTFSYVKAAWENNQWNVETVGSASECSSM